MYASSENFWHLFHFFHCCWSLPTLLWFPQRTNQTICLIHDVDHNVFIQHVCFPFCKLCSCLINLFEASGQDCGCSHMMNNSFLSCNMSLLVTLLIFVCRHLIILNGVLPPYLIHSFVPNMVPPWLAMWGFWCFTPPRNFLYLITFLACFFSPMFCQFLLGL